LHFFAQTHQGLKRPSNQDRYLLRELPDGRILAAVADGMGGIAGGEVAASMAVDLLAEVIDPSPEDHGALGELFASICRRVYAKAQAESDLKGMGTTLTAVLASPARVDWAHVGDSRLHRWRSGRLEQVTTDHTAAGFMAEEGLISEREAGSHPARHLLMDCIGCGDCDPDTGWFQPQDGELVLITTDGLHDKVRADDLARVLASSGSLPDKLQEMLDLALAAGGSDNITVAAIQFS